MSVVMNNHVFKGHKALLGNRYVTYGEVELPTREEEFAKSNNGFDWGARNSGSQQLAFSILRQLTSKAYSQEHAAKFSKEIIATLDSRDWILSTSDVQKWIKSNISDSEKNPIELHINEPPLKPKKSKAKNNVVKSVCKELSITQKELAHILEVPEGTISSWAVKNEIPRLGKKAIEFYILNAKNQKIVDSYKDFISLLSAS